jgi:GTP1/Obg family GTP-binding protein
MQKNKSFDRTEDDIVKDWTSSKINEGIFPFPAEKDTKVVNQLTQVANDSEEKVSQIFDVLSLTLDNNNEFRKFLKDYEKFLNSQASLLLSLNNKFPNIKLFDEHLSSTKSMSNSLNGMKDLLQSEDNKIFQAMELMQFNDINRQKIERVMSVIRKLSSYLNNLFEDDSGSKDIAVARHIHGDDTDDLIGDDLDKLIAEFSNNK